MSMKTVLTLMVVVGLLLAAYSFRLHEHLITVDENKARHACRELCKLGLMDAAGVDEESVGGLGSALAARACDAMDDDTELLLDCRDQLVGVGLSVADYRCIIAAKTKEEARACHESLR
ncbi:MAG: hypothetical protein ACQEXJ_07145 [Myxococcota bacterium]